MQGGCLGRLDMIVVGKAHHQDVQIKVHELAPIGNRSSTKASGERNSSFQDDIGDTHHLCPGCSGESNRLPLTDLPGANDAYAQCHCLTPRNDLIRQGYP
jgi:hypothetical protein